jgi:hypothetical protein
MLCAEPADRDSLQATYTTIVLYKDARHGPSSFGHILLSTPSDIKTIHPSQRDNRILGPCTTLCNSHHFIQNETQRITLLRKQWGMTKKRTEGA